MAADWYRLRPLGLRRPYASACPGMDISRLFAFGGRTHRRSPMAIARLLTFGGPANRRSPMDIAPRLTFGGCTHRRAPMAIVRCLTYGGPAHLYAAGRRRGYMRWAAVPMDSMRWRAGVERVRPRRVMTPARSTGSRWPNGMMPRSFSSPGSVTMRGITDTP